MPIKASPIQRILGFIQNKAWKMRQTSSHLKSKSSNRLSQIANEFSLNQVNYSFAQKMLRSIHMHAKRTHKVSQKLPYSLPISVVVNDLIRNGVNELIETLNDLMSFRTNNSSLFNEIKQTGFYITESIKRIYKSAPRRTKALILEKASSKNDNSEAARKLLRKMRLFSWFKLTSK